MEFVLEFFINVWIELAMKIVPEDKRNSKKIQMVCKLVVLFMVLYVIAAFTVGAVILADSIAQRALGVVLLSSSIVICVFQIVLGIIFYNKKHK